MNLRQADATSRLTPDMIRRALRLLPPQHERQTCVRAFVRRNHRELLTELSTPRKRPHVQVSKADPNDKNTEKRSSMTLAKPSSTSKKDARNGLFLDVEKLPTCCQIKSRSVRCSGGPSNCLSGMRPSSITAHLAFHQNDVLALSKLARLVGRGGDDAAARSLLERAVRHAPKNVKLRINLGIAYARLGNYEKARLHWRHALKLQPKNRDALTHSPTPVDSNQRLFTPKRSWLRRLWIPKL